MKKKKKHLLLSGVVQGRMRLLEGSGKGPHIVTATMRDGAKSPGRSIDVTFSHYEEGELLIMFQGGDGFVSLIPKFDEKGNLGMTIVREYKGTKGVQEDVVLASADVNFLDGWSEAVTYKDKNEGEEKQK